MPAWECRLALLLFLHEPAAGGSVFKDRHRGDDLQATIDDNRRVLAAREIRANADAERRSDIRRRLERRGQGTIRRVEDAERNQYRRALLLSFLGTLSHDDLLLWIDRLWLGLATEPQLDAVVASVRESPHFADRIASSRAAARPGAGEANAALPASNAWLSAEWRNLSEQLTVLTSLRREHHAAAQQRRNGSTKPSQYREAALASPIGTRIAAAGLFEEFFDRLDLTPSEMAARLLQREVETQLQSLDTSPRVRRALGSFTAAAAALTAVALFPRWRAFYRELRDRAQTPPADVPRR
jgi:hypothetical protein